MSACACGFIGEGLRRFSLDWHMEHMEAHLKAFPDVDERTREILRLRIDVAIDGERSAGGPAVVVTAQPSQCGHSVDHPEGNVQCPQMRPCPHHDHNHLTRDIKPPGVCPACDARRMRAAGRNSNHEVPGMYD